MAGIAVSVIEVKDVQLEKLLDQQALGKMQLLMSILLPVQDRLQDPASVDVVLAQVKQWEDEIWAKRYT